MEDKVWYLKQINLLKSLSERELMSLASQCKMISCKAGDRIELDSNLLTVYFLKTGAVRIEQMDDSSDFRIKEVIEPGEIFGYLGGVLTHGRERMIAQEESIICYLPFSQWKEVMQHNVSLTFNVYKWMGLRIYNLERKLESLFFKTAKQRTDDLFMDMVRRFGKRRPDQSVCINLNLTQEQMAQLTGCSRQNINAYLASLKSDRKIEFERKNIIISTLFLEENKATI